MKIYRFLRFLIPLLLVVSIISLMNRPSPQSAQAQDGGPSQERLDRLTKGINLSNWFWLGPDNVEQIAGRFTDEELIALRAMGFTNVRIPIAMQPFYDPENPSVPDAELLAALDTQVERLLGMDLAVIVDMHSVQVNEGDSVYSGDLETEDAFVEDFLLFWGGLAGHLKKYDPDMVFFEMFNEPVFLGNPSRWVDDILPRTLAAVREAAPDHTLIAEGWGWASIDGLLTVTPVDDPNVVYNFHFYDPFVFTHQGADWVDEREVAELFAVPYPADPENVVTMMFDRFSDAGQAAVMNYGAEEWNAEKLEERILRAVEWAEEHGVHIICTEFGAYAPVAPKNSRVQWITDVVTTFEKYGIGWVMWEYDAGFGFVERTRDASGNEVLKYDEDVLGAMGLTLPE